MPTKGYRTKDPKYATIHIWLKKDRGDPSKHPCQFCGGRATEWVCYQNKTKQEYRQTSWVSYSTNLDDYAPGCRSCNMKIDKPPQDVCRYGHDDWVPNKNKTHNKRLCNTCKKERYKKNRGSQE